jgi:hypothetical protein
MKTSIKNNKKLIITGRVWQCGAQIIIRFEEPKKKMLILGLSPVQTGVDATNSPFLKLTY